MHSRPARSDIANSGVTNNDASEEQIEDWLEGGSSFDVDPQWKNAQFLLHATEELALSHTGVDRLCGLVQWLVDSVGSEIAQRVEAKLPPTIDTAQKEGLLTVCEPGDIFSGLKTRYLREKYYNTHFHYVVRIMIALVCNEKPAR